jgi:hypothetical protein
MGTTVFLGLITHPKTQFPQSAKPTGFIPQLATTLSDMGVDVTIAIHDKDLYNTSIVAPTRTQILASMHAELELEHRWRSIVHPSTSRLALAATMTGRRWFRWWKYAAPWRANSAHAPGPSMIRRLVNIELAHLALLHQAQASGADWVLIAEDDAQVEDVPAFAQQFVSFTHERSTEEQPAYVNISRSFPLTQLGIAQYLTEVGQWSPGVALQSSELPLTNTVCAMLYRGSFIPTLTNALARIPVSPVLPIDWKLNAALLDLVEKQSLGSGDCWFLDPAPIMQGSMA